jgi:hypothetical protein
VDDRLHGGLRARLEVERAIGEQVDRGHLAPLAVLDYEA